MKRALVVDDDKTVAEVLKDMLQMEGWDVMVVDRVKKAIPLCETEVFDVVFSDLMMPDVRGDAFLEELKKKNSPMADRFIIITGADVSEEIQDKVKELGGRLIKKPFYLKDIKEILKDL
ncbi:MAG: response regulator [Nitrospirae bacterium]|nr:MAG: response regulator [Nitrospirota bacterium]